MSTVDDKPVAAVIPYTVLEAGAKQAEERNDFAGARDAWEAIIRKLPEDWRPILGLALCLIKFGQSGEAEKVFRRGAKLHPASFWLGYHSVLLAFREQRLDEAELRARRLLVKFNNSAPLLALLGEIAVAQHDFRTAAICFAAALAREPEAAGLVQKHERAQLYQRISEGFSRPDLLPEESKRGPDYAVFVLNLDNSVDRRLRIERELANCPVPVFRVPAVHGSYLPSVAARRLSRTREPKKGNVAIVLTHAAAWEAMLEMGLDQCLILEDDAVPVLSLPARFSDFSMPKGFDLCFANKGMEPICDEPTGDWSGRFRVYRPDDTVVRWPLDRNAPGTQGYLLSATGATKLLDLFNRDGFDRGVDWRLLSYSMQAGDVAKLPSGSVAAAVLRNSPNSAPKGFEAYALFPCLVAHDHGKSVRKVENSTRTLARLDL
jgi:GR25 family glycosyltransferase involved in LPS biosynthesis